MAHRNPLPDRSVLLASLDYDPEEGVLRWRYRPDVRPATNTMCVGKLAGNTDTHGYVRVHVNGKKCWAHRLIWKMATGEEPETIDHINGDPSDNRLSNLRAASNGENLRNRGAQRNNTSGFKGVYFSKAAQKWAAQIKLNGKPRYLGLYPTPEEAHAAYIKANEPTHGEYGRVA